MFFFTLVDCENTPNLVAKHTGKEQKLQVGNINFSHCELIFMDLFLEVGKTGNQTMLRESLGLPNRSHFFSNLSVTIKQFSMDHKPIIPEKPLSTPL